MIFSASLMSAVEIASLPVAPVPETRIASGLFFAASITSFIDLNLAPGCVTMSAVSVSMSAIGVKSFGLTWTCLPSTKAALKEAVAVAMT